MVDVLEVGVVGSVDSGDEDALSDDEEEDDDDAAQSTAVEEAEVVLEVDVDNDADEPLAEFDTLPLNLFAFDFFCLRILWLLLS